MSTQQRWPRQDGPMTRPPGLLQDFAESPPRLQTLLLALQQIAVQAIYLILPGVLGVQAGLLALDLVAFLALSAVAVALAGLLQMARSGPLGSGYPVASIPSPVFVAVYLLAVPQGGLAAAAALSIATGLAGLMLAARLKRLATLVPPEVAGVVVFLIGASLLPRAFAAATAPEAALRMPQAGLALATLAVMIGVALAGGRAARFAVLIGAAFGTALALPAGIGTKEAALLQAAPWLALPIPQFPTALPPASLLPAFLVALLASFASWTGDLVAMQRAADAQWRRPDSAPIRRGLAAQSLAVVLAGGIGAVPPGTSSASVGLAIGTRVLSRQVGQVAAVLLLALACCPKALALLLLLPAPVEAAMLGYVCCFMIAAGCQLMASRMLDTRRTFVVGIGIAVGLGALLGVSVMEADFPNLLRSPVTGGALVAIALHLVTLPLVDQRASFTLMPDVTLPAAVTARFEALGGAWGARPAMIARATHAVLEVGEVLAARGVPALHVAARHGEDSTEILLRWEGTPLPAPALRPEAADLEGSIEAQERFALWLATRGAERVVHGTEAGRPSLRLVYAD